MPYERTAMTVVVVLLSATMLVLLASCADLQRGKQERAQQLRQDWCQETGDQRCR